MPIIRSDRFMKPDANNLTFVNLNKNDHMVLQCNASNIHGYVFSDVYLNILGKFMFATNSKVVINFKENKTQYFNFLFPSTQR